MTTGPTAAARVSANPWKVTMTGIVVWWYCQEDGAVHAFYRAKLGHGSPVLTTVCDLDVMAHRVERHDDGPKCFACQLIVGPR